jgi:hypothetical protein
MYSGVMELESVNVFECAVFDWLTGQIDRHDANYLYDFKNRKIIPIDSAHAFLRYEGSLPDYLHLFEVGNSRELSKKIVSQSHLQLKVIDNVEILKLVPLRNEEERNALLKRKGQLSEVNSIQDVLNLYRSSKK